MVKVIMVTTIAHPVHGCAGPGQTISVDEETAKALLAGRYAKAFPPAASSARPSAAPEGAAQTQPETAMQPKASRKSR